VDVHKGYVGLTWPGEGVKTRFFCGRHKRMTSNRIMLYCILMRSYTLLVVRAPATVELLNDAINPPVVEIVQMMSANWSKLQTVKGKTY